MKSFFSFLSSLSPPLAPGSPPIKLPAGMHFAHSLQPNDSRWWCTSTQLKCTCIGYRGGGVGGWVRSPVTFLSLSQKSEEGLKMKYECHAGVIRQKGHLQAQKRRRRGKKTNKNHTCPACRVSSITHLFLKTMFVMNRRYSLFFVAQHDNKA